MWKVFKSIFIFITVFCISAGWQMLPTRRIYLEPNPNEPCYGLASPSYNCGNDKLCPIGSMCHTRFSVCCPDLTQSKIEHSCKNVQCKTTPSACPEMYTPSGECCEVCACQYKGEKYQVGQIFFGESVKCTCVKDGNGLKKAECERLEVYTHPPTTPERRRPSFPPFPPLPGTFPPFPRQGRTFPPFPRPGQPFPPIQRPGGGR